MGVASMSVPVCITESVVVFNNALGSWRLCTQCDAEDGRRHHKLFGKPLYHVNNSTWIENAPPEWQERFGDALGRVLAHEVWHQLWSQGNSVGETRVGAPHPNKSYDGIEEEACGDSWFKNSPTVGFRSAGRGWILDQIDQLDRAQGPEKTVSIKRRP